MWLKTFVGKFARPTTLTWRSLLVACSSDLDSEKLWAAARKPVMQRLNARGLNPNDIQSLRFEDLLSDAEIYVWDIIGSATLQMLLGLSTNTHRMTEREPVHPLSCTLSSRMWVWCGMMNLDDGSLRPIFWWHRVSGFQIGMW